MFFFVIGTQHIDEIIDCCPWRYAWSTMEMQCSVMNVNYTLLILDTVIRRFCSDLFKGHNSITVAIDYELNCNSSTVGLKCQTSK